MEASHDADDAWPVSRGRVIRRRFAVVVLALVTAAALPAVSGAAAGAPEPKKDVKKELAELQKKADALNKEYRGELLSLAEAKKAADKAAADADRVSREWTEARTDVSRIAATAYINGSMDAIPIVTGGDPDNMLKDAVVLQHLSRNNGMRVQNLQTLAAQAAKSQQEAKAKVAEVRKQVDELEGQRTKVKKLLAKFKPEKPATPRNGRPDGAASGGKSPIIGNSMTSRMRNVLLSIDNRFGPFSVIGCYRAGDPQDHGSGHACDFMESTAGRMPSAGAQAHGDSVAQYAISNASSLGVKYVIWKQRIWDVRSGGGWRAMSNRGGITANHFDHIHISVL